MVGPKVAKNHVMIWDTRGHVPFCLTRSFLFVTMRSISKGVYQQQRRLPAAKACKTLLSSHILLTHILPSVNNAWWFAQFQSVSSMLLTLNFKSSHLDCRDVFLISYSFHWIMLYRVKIEKIQWCLRLLYPFFDYEILWQLIIFTSTTNLKQMLLFYSSNPYGLFSLTIYLLGLLLFYLQNS